MEKQYVIRLSATELAKAIRLAESSAVPARVQLWAAILLAAHDGQRDLQIASRLRTSVATVQRTRKRCATEGFEAAVRWTESISVSERNGPKTTPEWAPAIFAKAREVDGLLGVAVADLDTGTCLAKDRGDGLDLDLAAAGNAEVVRAKLTTIDNLALGDSLEDVLVTLTTRYHLIRVLPTPRRLFVFATLDRQSANLALARHQFAAMDWSEVR